MTKSIEELTELAREYTGDADAREYRWPRGRRLEHAIACSDYPARGSLARQHCANAERLAHGLLELAQREEGLVAAIRATAVGDIEQAERERDAAYAERNAALSALSAATSECERLRAGLAWALEALDEAWPYAGDFFEEKWRDKAKEAELRALLPSADVAKETP